MHWIKKTVHKFPVLYGIVKLLNSIKNKLFRLLNSLGNNKQCYICKKSFSRFKKYRGGSGNSSQFCKNINIIGTDPDNFGCPFCFCTDRDRHFFAYFDKLNLWPNNESRILHFAPEIQLYKKIESCNPLEYIKADWTPESYINRGIKDVKKINLMEIPFENNHFDIVICNHVLEHVPNLQKGLAEIYRVLKIGGFAILQTPVSQLLHKNFEDPGITTDTQKIYFYGQNDHVRIISKNQFFEDLENQGFKLAIVPHEDLFDNDFAKIHGVNAKEDLIRVIKL